MGDLALDGQQSGALVISLDFELHWGVRDISPLDRAERSRLLSARRVIPRLLDLFEEFSISATWATVGFLFARTKEEAEFFSPAKRPSYRNSRLDPYREQLGLNESDDPFHFAPSLIDEIASRRGQEIASHSFSHFYSLEEGQTIEEFEHDLSSAVAIASNAGYNTRSYVFPRNQVNVAYLPTLQQAGIVAYRGTEHATWKKPTCFSKQHHMVRRLTCFLDCYVDIHGSRTFSRPDFLPMASVAASRYLRPYNPFLQVFDNCRYQRISRAIKCAAERRKVFHLWWHPEDFATYGDENLQFLRRILETFDLQRTEYGMYSASMLGISNATGAGQFPCVAMGQNERPKRAL